MAALDCKCDTSLILRDVYDLENLLEYKKDDDVYKYLVHCNKYYSELLNGINGFKGTLIHATASKGYVRSLSFLLDLSKAFSSLQSDLNKRDLESYSTPLHKAIKCTKLSSAEILYRNQFSNLDTLDMGDNVPLELAPVTSNGQKVLFVQGTNYNNNLGLGYDRSKKNPDIHDYFLNKKISFVFIGEFHSIFIANNFKVYTCGYGHEGSLGVENETTLLTPTLVSINENCIEASVSKSHTLLLTEKGNVFSYGSNRYGQLGIRESRIFLPSRVIISRGIIGVSVGETFSIAWTNSSLYAWGQNFGQLGLFINDKLILRPTRVTRLDGQRINQVLIVDTCIYVLTHSRRIFKMKNYEVTNISNRCQAQKITCKSSASEKLMELIFQDSLTFIYPIKMNKTISIESVHVSSNILFLIGYNGWLYKTEFKDSNLKLKLDRLPGLHRVISVDSDPKGNNIGILCEIYEPEKTTTKFIDDLVDDSFLINENEEFEDEEVIIISSDNIKHKANKLILTRKCLYFQAMFRNSFRESQSSSIYVDIPSNVLNEILYYIGQRNFSSKLEDTTDLDFICETLCYAQPFLLPTFNNFLVHKLKTLTSIKNATELFQLSLFYGYDELKIHTVQFLTANIAYVLENRLLENLSIEDLSHFANSYSLDSSSPPFDNFSEILENLCESPKINQYYVKRITKKTSKNQDTPILDETQSHIAEDNNISSSESLIVSEKTEAIEINSKKMQKKNKLSQKDRKKLLEQQQSPINSPPKSNWAGWDVSQNKNPSVSLNDILKDDNKEIFLKKTPKKKYVKGRTSYTSISLEDSPVPWKLVSSPPSDFKGILEEECSKSLKAERTRKKSLRITQIEEAAINDLQIFYNTFGLKEEIVTVKRVHDHHFVPNWSKNIL